MRPLAAGDYARGHLALLSGLTEAPDVGEAAYLERFRLLQSIPETYYIIVFTAKDNKDKIVASGSLIKEHKFIRANAASGHIEDIVVDPEIRGKGLGKKMLQGLIVLAKSIGIYKALLDCSDENRGEVHNTASPGACVFELTIPSKCRILREVRVRYVSQTTVHAAAADTWFRFVRKGNEMVSEPDSQTASTR